MVTPKIPKGDDRVALGTKAKKEEDFALHKAGTHTESDYEELGKNPSKKKALKPHIDNRSQGGSNA